MQPIRKIDYRPDIDGLRAVAILSVLLFHLGTPGFGGGFVGVDIFFVISGFLISRLIKEEIERSGRFSFKNFYARRIRRLFPAYFIVLLVTTIVAVLVFSPSQLQRFGGALASAMASLSNVYFWLESDYFDIASQLKPLLHTWSLSVEEQFYLLWPAVLIVLLKRETRYLVPAVLILASIFSLGMNWLFSDGSNWLIDSMSESFSELFSDGGATIFFLLPFRVFEFSIGALLVWVIPHPGKQWLYDLLFAIGFLLIAISVLIFNEELVFPSFYALVPCLGAAMIIYAGQESRLSPVLSNRLFVGIGLISYSLYLVHWPIIVFWSYVVEELSFTSKVVILGLSFFSAYFSYRYIEQPFRKRNDQIEWRKLVSSTMLASLVLFALGITMKLYSGWTWRISPEFDIEVVGNASDYQRIFYGGSGYGSYAPVNSKESIDIVLLGDSHGKHYAEGLDSLIAQPNGLVLYVASGTSCFHLPKFTRKTAGYDWDSWCVDGLDKALKVIVDADTPPLILISHSWLYQLSRADLLDENGHRMGVRVGVGDVLAGISALKRKVGNSIIVVIGRVPGARRNLYDVLTRPDLSLPSQETLEGYLNSNQREEFVEFNRLLRAESEQSKEFVFLDPHDVLCRDGVCKNIDNQGRLIYSDTSHLSKYGSRFVIDGFSQELIQNLESLGKL